MELPVSRMFSSVADRERVFFSDEDKQDYKQEALKQSVRRISSQMTKLSNIIFHTVDCDDVSGKFSSFPIHIKELARNSDDSVPKEADLETNCYERIPTGSENVPSDTGNVPTEVENVSSNTCNAPTEIKNVPSDTGNLSTEAENVPSDPEKVVNGAKNASTDVEIGDRNLDIIPNDAEIATTRAEGTATGGDEVAKSAYSRTGNDVYTPPSPDGSVAILEDTPIPSESRDTSTRRIKNKAKKMRSFFKKKSRKDERKERCLESPV